MKALALVLLVSTSLSLAASEVRLGDNFANVKQALGVPRGQLRVGDRQLLYFDRGEIELQAGLVSRVALLSAEEHAVLETKRAALAARIREEQEIRRTQLSAEGERLMARKLADPAFQAAPAAYQVAFWEDFSRRYPDVSAGELLTSARLRNIEELEAKRARYEEAVRLADLEARLWAAEARVANVETSRYRTRNYYHYDNANHQPFTPMPVEYHYFDVIHSAAASPSPFNTQSRNRYDNMTLPPRTYQPTRLDRSDNSYCAPSTSNDHAERGSSGFPRRVRL